MARIMEDANSSGEGKSSGGDGFSSATGCCLGIETVVTCEASAEVASDAAFSGSATSFSGSDEEEKRIALYWPLDEAKPCGSFEAIILKAVATLLLDLVTKP
jgi:hypothetical protein